MPYCPKCDMEFVEGVTVCTDCGRPLFPSREEAMAAQKQEEEMAGELKSQALAAALTASEGNARETPRVHAYVKKSQKREDLKSSAAAFAPVGAALAAASLVLWTGILDGPLLAVRDWVFELLFQGSSFPYYIIAQAILG